MFSLLHIVKLCTVTSLLLFTELGFAAPPELFSATYDARYRGLRAEATISLSQQNDGLYFAQSLIRIKIFGATITSINETSVFDWVDDYPRPIHYQFIQSGLGKRKRMIDFDWQNNIALASVDNELTELMLRNPVVDELSMYTRIKQALSEGEQEIYFDVIDRNLIEEYHYQVLGEETVSTDLGNFNALKVERIREDSERVTQLWFSPDHDMLLIKIFQRDPDGDEYEITIENGQIDGSPVLIN